MANKRIFAKVSIKSRNKQMSLVRQAKANKKFGSNSCPLKEKPQINPGSATTSSVDLLDEESITAPSFAGSTSQGATTRQSFSIESNQDSECTNIFSGRRIVDVMHFFQQIKKLNNHFPFECNISNMEIISEIRKGLISNFILKCNKCHIQEEVVTDNIQDSGLMNINTSTVLAAVSTGVGHSAINEMHAILNIPSMSYRQYHNADEDVADVILKSCFQSMKDAGRDEGKLASELGEVDKQGIPCITVVADGAWSKRSYKTNYDALSGVSCIVGARTGKVLFLGVRNKYCCICDQAAKKNVRSKEHKCSKNWEGTSTSMEADIILEGFNLSMEMHGLKYTKLVGDGDSSVYKKLCLQKPYGPTVTIQKIECTNHLMRNYCRKLVDLSKKRYSSTNMLVAPHLRKTLHANIMRLRTGITKAIAYRKAQNAPFDEIKERLIKDIKNCPNHVFGDHINCDEYFCKRAKSSDNLALEMKKCGLMAELTNCSNRLCQNASSLLLNMQNNSAEMYNSIVCKFVGGKRINLATKGGYETRCKAAVVAYNEKHNYLPHIYKTMMGCKPGYYVTKFVEKKKKIMLARRTRRQIFRKKVIIKKSVSADEDYGATTELDEAEIEARSNEFLEYLKKSKEEISEIEKNTRGQARQDRWKEERRYRLTASNFGRVCKLRKTTNREKICKSLLSSEFVSSKAIRWGRAKEEVAKGELEKRLGLTVQNCGFHIDEENCFLGASPDGRIDEDTIIEIKCPWSIASFKPEDAVKNKKLPYLVVNEKGAYCLRRTHNYFYQVQGQLAITNSTYCLFVVWTPLGMVIDKIKRDELFWKTEMLPKLKQFYLEGMLKQIVK